MRQRRNGGQCPSWIQAHILNTFAFTDNLKLHASCPSHEFLPHSSPVSLSLVDTRISCLLCIFSRVLFFHPNHVFLIVLTQSILFLPSKLIRQHISYYFWWSWHFYYSFKSSLFCLELFFLLHSFWFYIDSPTFFSSALTRFLFANAFICYFKHIFGQ